MNHTENESRFYELAWPHMGAILRTAQCLTHSDADAEDLTQETMLKAFMAIDTVRDGMRVKAWLMTILRRVGIDLVRATKSCGSLEELEFEPARDDATGSRNSNCLWCDPEDVLDFFNDEVLILALRDLPKEIRWTLLLVDVEGLSQREASHVLAVPVGTVKSRLYRGRAMLRTTLRADGQLALLAV